MATDVKADVSVSASIRPEPAAARQLLGALVAPGDTVTFQTFGERDKDRSLARVLHGTLDDVFPELSRLNGAGAGVFFMVNQGDGEGRAARNVTAIRALFVDLDGAPLEPVQTCALAPHIIVESSPGRFHAYWRIADCDLNEFSIYQKVLAARFNGDTAVHDLPRVMRLPGFLHQKREPFVTRILQRSEAPPYTPREIAEVLDLQLQGEDPAPPAGDTTPTTHVIKGDRNNRLTTLAGKLRQQGLSRDAIEATLIVTNRERCQPPLDDAEVRAIAASVARYEASDDATGIIWPPIMLPGMEPIPDLPATLLPSWLGDMSAAIARSTQTPPAAAVLLSLAVLAACVQRRFEVAPKNNEYCETLSLWIIVALASGTRKTAVLGQLLAPLLAWEKRQQAASRSSIARVKAARGIAKKRIEKLEMEAAKAKTEEDRQEVLEELRRVIEETPNEIFAPRLITGDTTTERLQGLLAEQRERIALFSDESGIFTVLAGLYSGGQIHLDAFLQAHSGAAIRVDRANRVAHIDRPALSFGLALQPKVLQEVANVRRFRDSGFLARFLFALPASTVGKRDVRATYSVPVDVIERYHAGLNALLEGAGDDAKPPRILTLTESALECWLTFAEEIEHAMDEGGRLEGLADWAGKLPGHAARIAGLLQLAVSGLTVEEIDIEAMQRAVDLCQLLIVHALAAFHMLGADEQEADALVLLQWIRANPALQFDRTTAHKALQARFRAIDRFKAAARRLREWNVISDEQRRVNVNARMSPYYLVNPALFDETSDSQKTV